jgi:hypothetical protein
MRSTRRRRPAGTKSRADTEVRPEDPEPREIERIGAIPRHGTSAAIARGTMLPFLPRLVAASVLGAGLFAASAGRADDATDQASASASAGAPAAPPDTIYLRNGGMIRGRVQEILPTAYITVTLSTGEVKKVPWGEVERVIVASAATVPSLPPLPATPDPAPKPPPSPPPPMVGPLVRVHVTSSKKVELHRKRDGVGGTSGWVHACMSPCDLDLPAGDTYKVTGSGILSSSDLRLHEGPNHTATLVVDPTSVSGMVLGGLLGGAGGWGAYVGLLMVAIGGAQAEGKCYGPYDNTYATSYGASFDRCERERRTGPGLRDAGFIVLGTSVLVGIAGVLVLWKSASTDVSQPAAAPPNDAFLREPTWKKPSALESAARPPVSTFLPLIDARF